MDENEALWVINVGSSRGKGEKLEIHVHYYIEADGEKVMPVFSTQEKAADFTRTNLRENVKAHMDLLESSGDLESVQALTEGHFTALRVTVSSIMGVAAQLGVDALIRDPRPGDEQELIRVRYPRGGWMNFDFPEPYDVEVPRRIGEARRQLSPEGVAVLERVIADESGDLEGIIAAMESLPATDRRILVGVSRFFAEAYDARIRESQGWADLHRQLAGLIVRARELEPSLRVGATLGEAIVVLKRHGEPLGISDEVLEIAVEMPEEEPPPSGREV
jgi:hypothetical protein